MRQKSKVESKMSSLEEIRYSDESNPIDYIESLADRYQWEFSRIAEDVLTVTVQADWNVYTIYMTWSEIDLTLKVICEYAMEMPEERHTDILEIVNLANGTCGVGGFAYWKSDRRIVYRHTLMLGGSSLAQQDVNNLQMAAITACERFYPAFMMVAMGDKCPDDAIGLAITEHCIFA